MLRLLVFRYAASLRRRSVIGWLAGISVIGVGVSTAAMVIVLSAFNGLEGLISDLYASWDPALKVEPVKGKFFALGTIPYEKIKKIEGVETVTAVLEDNALLRNGDLQLVVRVKGVEATYPRSAQFDSAITEGAFELNRGPFAGLVVGYAVQQALGIGVGNQLEPIQLWYPKRNARLGLDPTKSFTKRPAMATGVFRLEKQYDEKYVFGPVELVEQLTGRVAERSFIEIELLNNQDPDRIKGKLEALLGPQFRVLTYREQHATLARILNLERLFVYVALTVILLISSFNIFTALSMLAVEKRRDMEVLLTMGAEPGLIGKVFLGIGFVVAGLGAALGLGLGVALCLAQQTFGLVSMGMATSIVASYPVALKIGDLAIIVGTVLVTTLAISWMPAKKAGRVLHRVSI
jgi:lipoprotein-releasing system permease protein